MSLGRLGIEESLLIENEGVWDLGHVGFGVPGLEKMDLIMLDMSQGNYT